MPGTHIAVATDEDLKQAISPAIALCYRYWTGKRALCGPGRLPGREHLDPVEMVRFLAHVVLFDVVRNGSYYRFRHRLTGTHFAEIFGRDVTGLYIEQTGSLETFEAIYRRFTTIVDDKAPAYGISPSPVRDRDFLEYEHLTLPLATDGQTVDLLFGVRCVLQYRRRPFEAIAVSS
ncbi:MAG TPA: PAS domain-containing protein [Alphaproteobacteria bacterium]